MRAAIHWIWCRGPRTASALILMLTLSTREFRAQAEPSQPDAATDEIRFREGLRQRGLDEWLEQYLTETPPVDAVDAALRDRERLLQEASAPGRPHQERRGKIQEAGEILSQLVANHPAHPARPGWQLELARDRLERIDPTVFDALLLYELPGRDPATAVRLSDEALDILRSLRTQIEQTWEKLGTLDERAAVQAADSRWARELEQIDAQARFLEAWARLYAAMDCAQDAQARATAAGSLLDEITNRYGWTTPAEGTEVQRCRALSMAAVSARLAGRYAEAERFAREIITTIQKIRTPADRERVREASLMAVLEQVRGLRDTGRLAEAAAALDQARAWAERTRAGEFRTELAMALLERSILIAQAEVSPSASDPAFRPGLPPFRPCADRLLGGDPTQGSSSEAQPSDNGSGTANGASPGIHTSGTEAGRYLEPLEHLAAKSPAIRDALYQALAGAVADDDVAGCGLGFELQLLAGGWIADAAGGSVTTQPAGGVDRMGELIRALASAHSEARPEVSELLRGEWVFLEARARYLIGDRLEAVKLLCDLGEHWPAHDRSSNAVLQATAIAREALLEAPSSAAVAARAAFVRAARLLRQRAPNSPLVRDLQFTIAAALDESGQLEEAAREYAAVPLNDPNALRAAWARARCLRDLLDLATASRPAEQAGAPAARALEAAQMAMELTSSTRENANTPAPQTATSAPAAENEACLRAEIVLLLASLQNHPAVRSPAQALTTLEGFEKAHAGCQAALGRALRERVNALRQLKRMGEAREVVEQFLAAEPEHAGPIMARLLEAMRDEILAAADRGEEQAVRTIGDEAARLAGRLLEWAESRAGRMKPAETVTVAVWRAWSLLQAGQAQEALDAYEKLERTPPDLLPGDSALQVEIRLGKAECLLRLNKATEALPILMPIWQTSAENSPYWWRAYAGTMDCHAKLGSDPHQIVQSIRQQKHLHPELGGPRWKRALERIEAEQEIKRTASPFSPG